MKRRGEVRPGLYLDVKLDAVEIPTRPLLVVNMHEGVERDDLRLSQAIVWFQVDAGTPPETVAAFAKSLTDAGAVKACPIPGDGLGTEVPAGAHDEPARSEDLREVIGELLTLVDRAIADDVALVVERVLSEVGL